MLERNDSAKHAKAKFFEAFNDIDVFVEDTARESRKVYCELLTRALGNHVTVTQVFPIGSKEVVLARCAADQGVRARRAVYIVDGDYELLTGSPPPGLRRLFRLPRYSIENYLCDEAALVDVISDETIRDDRAQVEVRFEFDHWVANVSKPLADLLTACFAAHCHQCGMPSVNVQLSLITGEWPDHVDATKTDALVASYATKVDGHSGAGTFSALKSRVAAARGGDDYKYVRRYGPAKTLLFPLLLRRVRRRHGLNLNERLLRCKIARRCDIAELREIEAAIC